MAHRAKQRRARRESITEAFQERWQRPMRMEFEEVVSHGGQRIDDERNRASFLMHVDTDGLERIRQKLACHHCGQTFPAPPSARNAYLFRDCVWPQESWEDTERILGEERCPMCQAPITDAELDRNDVTKAWEPWTRYADGRKVEVQPTTIWLP